MELKDSVAVVTGGNRGFGRHLAEQLLARGAEKVYAAVRRPETVDLPGVVPLRLDLTDPASIAAAAEAAPDATLLVNNAGVSTHTPLIEGDFANIRLEMETHFFGPLAMARAFAPALARDGQGAILNVLSVLSWVHVPQYAAYGAGKAAAWAMSNAVREELVPRGVQVTSLHVGYLDTDMSSYVEADKKSDPAAVAKIALDGVATGAREVLADDITRQVKSGLSVPLDAA